MSDITLDLNTNDIIFTNDDLVLTEGVTSREQHLQIRLQTILGEWFLDTTTGVPFLQQLFKSKVPDPTIIQAAIRSEVEKTPGIISMTDFSYKVDSVTRNLDITFKAISEEGNFPVTFTQGV